MKTLNYKIEDESVYDALTESVVVLIQSSASVLIQLFSSKERASIDATLQELYLLFPHAHIIGATTDGEIIEGEVLLASTTLSVTLFDKTELQSTLIELEDSFQAGVSLAKKLVSSKTKLLLTFADGIECNAGAFLDGIYSIAHDVKVAGGLAADSARFERTYLFYNAQMHSKAVVGVALDSDLLEVTSLYSFGWEEIGITHTITKSEGRRVYEIDGISMSAFYAKYLGDEVSKNLPATGIEFPLMVQRDGFVIARAATHSHDDGSLSFAGNIIEGEKVRLGIGDAQKILSNPMEALHTTPSEAYFIYSCMARRRFMPKLIQKELLPFAHRAPTSGFFTYGEFYTHEKPLLLNETLTAVALSETKRFEQNSCAYQQPSEVSAHDRTFSALSHLIHQITKEYNAINENLHRKIDLVTVDTQISMKNFELLLETMSEGVAICDASNRIIDANQALSDIFGYTKKELLNMTLFDVIRSSKVEDIQECMRTSEPQTFEAEFESKSGKRVYAIVSSRSKDHGGSRIRITTIVDISEIKEKDNQMLQQSRLAQMGEMINMIAHQWRQPLNAISAAAIKMHTQNELGILSSQEVVKSTKFIEKMTQKMSKTINDFMSFNKPDREMSEVLFYALVEEILSLIGAQLETHNIEVRLEVDESLKLITYAKELEHILINLLMNAKDALDLSQKSRKIITIRAYEKSGRCVIEVADNGGGIPSDVISRVFDPYFTTKEEGKGTGLGLYMSRRMIEEHLKGSIAVSNTAEGACFTIELEGVTGAE